MWELLPGFLLFLAICAAPVVIAELLFGDRKRADRIEESMEYNPDPIWQARFTTPDEEKRRQG
jgi:hypothetical protein